ncbi:hypothetical protein GKC33_08365 [Lactobacillus salivarius]|uniref:Uncharacterized protein n=1 Tax=Ligilactobacillus salivarius TaxID=1624 RepID=A0A6A8LMX0_9LACO|nr:hypothetical protein [Ligilactobacillus salivarius]MSE08708.1 hypothetical protein [Ligilactobacillus salivarius]
MKKVDVSVEEAKQILLDFFESDGYYLWRDNLEQSDNKNRISLLFETSKRDGADIRLLQYLPRIEGWSLSDSSVHDSNIFIEMVKKENHFRKYLFKLLHI